MSHLTPLLYQTTKGVAVYERARKGEYVLAYGPHIQLRMLYSLWGDCKLKLRVYSSLSV
jgi:hypothetical protein